MNGLPYLTWDGDVPQRVTALEQSAELLGRDRSVRAGTPCDPKDD